MITLPQTAEYALRAVIHIAGGRERVRVGDLAQELDLPRNYLSKILHQLARAGVLNSTRGPRGGFRLAVPADELTLATILEPFGTLDEVGCLLGRGQCGDADPCAAHWRWKSISAELKTFFNETTVAQLHAGKKPTRVSA